MTSALPPSVQACSGALASASANTISYPLDLVATKVQTTRDPRFHDLRGAIRTIQHILQKHGLLGLYDGLAPDTASTSLSNFLYFYFYTLLHAILARRRARSSVSLALALKRALTAPTPPVLLGVPTELAVGFIAGVASRAVSTPLSVITVRLQSDADEDDTEVATNEIANVKANRKLKMPSTMADTVRRIYADQGLRGFWAGFTPTLPLALTPALTLLFFQFFRRLRLPFLGPYSTILASSRRAAFRAFLDGACANALALALLYPLVLAKVRVQAWRGAPASSASPESLDDGDRVGGSRAAPTMVDVWRLAYVQSGWAGLYDGLGVQLLKGFVSQGVTMMVKQRIEQAVVRVYLRQL